MKNPSFLEATIMIGRRQFALAGLSAAAWGAMQAVAGADEKEAAGATADSETFEACAKACSDCQRICDSCATHCAELLNKGEHHHFNTLMSCQDCADVCSAAAQIVARKGPFADLVCQACA